MRWLGNKNGFAQRG